MSSKIIPKEQLSAYQRWELNALNEPSARDGDMKLPTAGELERIHQQAYQEGFAAGIQDGRVQAQAAAENIQRFMSELDEALKQLDQQMEQQVLALAIEIARQMLRQALQVQPELILAVVREAINSLPQASQHPTLVLHPQDAALVRPFLDAEKHHSAWRIHEDSQIERGGCRVETANSEIDATLESRWKRVVAALGADASWLG